MINKNNNKQTKSLHSIIDYKIDHVYIMKGQIKDQREKRVTENCMKKKEEKFHFRRSRRTHLARRFVTKFKKKPTREKN